ncbi:uncharacterized protein LOC126622448 [Malus sylvestris]|uniref:uncharacterized protein LOC126622448 n=1 Tax=Malus sylvestris TaxID=3752 RepID=UPI0021AC4C1D|nr:uncharacterized protein LOC126622448 [Malus sylvestris]
MQEPTDLFGGKQLVTPVPAHLSRHRNPRKYRQPSNSPLILILPRLLHLLICDCDPSRFHLFDSESRISLYLGNEFLENPQIQDTQKPGKESPKPKSLESLRQRGTEHPDPSEVRSTHPPCPKRQLRALHRGHQNGRRQERRRFDPEATDGPDRSLGRGNPEEDLCQPPREATRELRLQISVVLHKICV